MNASRDPNRVAAGACPDAAELRAVLDATLDHASTKRIENHLIACPECIALLDHLSRDVAIPLERMLEAYRQGDTDGAGRGETVATSDPRGRLDPPAENKHPTPGSPGEGAYPDIPGYEVLEEIGRGGMGVVFRARHLALQRDVALKMISEGVLAGPERIARFAQEAAALAKIEHPQIVRIYDVGEQSGIPYFALELARGGSLRDQLDGTPWSPFRAASLIETLARAMHAAHQAGVVHRDLSPGNLLFAQPILEDDRESFEGLRVSDFGLAHDVENPRLTYTGAAMGTPFYLSPEQANADRQQMGPGTDVYSMGCLLFELLTGVPPLRGATVAQTLELIRREDPASPRVLNPALPRDLTTICLKCLHKSPRQRYLTAENLADDLNRFLTGRPIAARPTSIGTRTVKWVGRHPALASLLGLSLVFVVALGSLWMSFTKDLQVKAEEAARNEAEVRAQLQQVLQARAATADVFQFLVDKVLGSERASQIGGELSVAEMLRIAGDQIDPTYGKSANIAGHLHLSIGRSWQRLGEFGEAESRYEAAIRRFGEAHGVGSREVAMTRLDLTDVLLAQQRMEDAAIVFEALQEHSDVLVPRNRIRMNYSYGKLLLAQSRNAEAATTLATLHQQSEEVLGKEHIVNIDVVGLLGRARYLNDPADVSVEALLRENHEGLCGYFGPDHAESLDAAQFLANYLFDVRSVEPARALTIDLLRRCQSVYGPDHERTKKAAATLARIDEGAG